MSTRNVAVKRYILLAIGFLIAIILTASALYIYLLREKEISTWKNYLSDMTIILADQTNQTMSSGLQALDSIIDLINRMNVHNAGELRKRVRNQSFHNQLKERITNLPYIDVATVTDDKGDVLNFTRSWPPKPINLADRDYFKVQHDTADIGLFIGKTVKNKGNGKLVFYLSKRLNDTEGKFAGIVLVGISVDQFTQFYEKLGVNLGEDAGISLYRNDFTLLARWPMIEELIGKANRTGTTFNVIEKEKKTSDVIYQVSPRFNNPGVTVARLGSVRALERFPLLLNLTITDQFFLGSWRNASRAIVLIAGGSILALVVSGLLLLRLVRQREESSRMLQDLSEQIPGALFQIRKSTDGNFLMPYLSPGASNILIFSSTQLPVEVKDAFSNLHTDDHLQFWNSIRNSAETLKTWSIDFRLIAKDKQISWQHVDAKPEKQEDGSTLWHGYITDITERKKLENIKSEFISIVSHELRTPLTSIRGALGLLTGAFSASIPEKARELLQMANSNSERLTVMINDLLDLEKMDSGKFRLEYKPVDIKTLTEQAIKAAEGYASQYQVSMKLVEAPEGLVLQADENRLLQVYANLLSNAIKFSSEGGTIEVSVKKTDDHVKISVLDHGHGIPQSFRSRMFERFSQADSSDTRSKGGSGLGLSITKAIIEQHGGNIDFISAEGKGTEFFFELPLTRV